MFTDLSDIDNIVESAKVAQKKWGALTNKKRSEVLYNYRNLLVKYRNEIANLIHIDNGKTMIEALAEVGKAIELTDFACSIPQIISGESQEVSSGIFCREEKRPVGVGLVISPFNFPIMVPHWSVPNAIATGNAIILKGSEQTPLATSFMADLWKEAGLPDGVLNIVNGAAEVVTKLLENKEIGVVTFVGSTPIAKLVYEKGTLNGKRVLSLGGAKNHVLAIKDAPVESTAKQILASAVGMAGQRCMAQSVLLVVDKQPELIKAMLKEAQSFKYGYNFPPIVSQASIDNMVKYIEHAEKMGAKILLDGRKIAKPTETTPDKSKSKSQPTMIGPKGFWFGATIIDWTGLEDKMGSTEVFGPVLEVIQTKNISEALEIQDRSPYGNASSVFTSSGRIAQQVVAHSHGGMIGVNVGVPVPREPFSFGGTRGSKFGYGDITGKSSLNLWTKLIKVTTKWDAEKFDDWMS